MQKLFDSMSLFDLFKLLSESIPNKNGLNWFHEKSKKAQLVILKDKIKIIKYIIKRIKKNIDN
jgi:hypothetical protein